jgi:hypothetical protein
MAHLLERQGYSTEEPAMLEFSEQPSGERAPEAEIKPDRSILSLAWRNGPSL